MDTTPASVSAPFFDRLGSRLAAEDGDRVPDAANLEQSLRRDLLRLFNVRNGLAIEQFLREAHSALHYGLPDTLRLSAQSSADLQCWQRVIARAIALYEPRLTQTRVQVRSDILKPTSACVNISAVATLGRTLCQVHFDLVLDGWSTAPALEPQP